MGAFNLANLGALRNLGAQPNRFPNDPTRSTAFSVTPGPDMRPPMPQAGGLFPPQPGPDMRPPMPQGAGTPMPPQVGPDMRPPVWGGPQMGSQMWPQPPGGGIDPRLMNLLALRQMMPPQGTMSTY